MLFILTRSFLLMLRWPRPGHTPLIGLVLIDEIRVGSAFVGDVADLVYYVHDGI